MLLSSGQLLLLSLLLTCLGSFTWGMRCFFVQPSGNTQGMRVTKAFSSVFALTHCAAILLLDGPPFWSEISAITLYVLALMLFWWAIKTNRDHRLSAVFSSDLPSKLVNHGPYRFIRHPFYMSYLLTWIAGIPASGQVWLLASVAVMFAIYFKAARMEEDKFRKSKLSEEYGRYASRTGMFFPRFVGGDAFIETGKLP